MKNYENTANLSGVSPAMGPGGISPKIGATQKREAAQIIARVSVAAFDKHIFIFLSLKDKRRTAFGKPRRYAVVFYSVSSGLSQKPSPSFMESPCSRICVISRELAVFRLHGIKARISRRSETFVYGTVNDVVLLLFRELVEIHRITGNSYRELGIFFGVSLSVEKSFAIEYVDVEMMSAVGYVSVEHIYEIIYLLRHDFLLEL